MTKTLYHTVPTSPRNRYVWLTLQMDVKKSGIGIGWNYEPDEYALTNYMEIRIAFIWILQFSMQWGKPS